MKKLLTAILLAAMLISVFGCGAKPGKDGNSTAEPTESAGDAPITLSFDSIGAFSEFAASTALDDAAFEAYMLDNSLGLYGIGSRAEAADAAEQISGLPLPACEGYELRQISYTPGHGECTMAYAGADGQICNFCFSTAPDGTGLYDKALSSYSCTEESPSPTSGFQKLCRIENSGSSSVTSFFALIDGRYALIRVRNVEGDPFEDCLAGFTFSLLEDSIKGQ